MKHKKYNTRRNAFRCGFTIVEMLIVLAITGILLTAVAAAFNASAVSYQKNENIFKAVNTIRLALFRITTQLRTAAAVDPDAPSNQCALITADGDDITYSFNSSDNKLYMNADTGTYALCDNITTMNFQKDTATEAGVVFVKSVRITATVAVGDVQREVSAAAVVRRNLD